jgi:hypothetical protein
VLVIMAIEVLAPSGTSSSSKATARPHETQYLLQCFGGDVSRAVLSGPGAPERAHDPHASPDTWRRPSRPTWPS